MKKYETPKLEITIIEERDVITTSPGTFGPTIDEDFGVWDVEFGI